MAIEPLETRALLAADLFLRDSYHVGDQEPTGGMLDSAQLGQDPLLRQDAFGNAYYFDRAPEIYGDGEDSPIHGDPREVAIPLLHSKPDATRKIFLDFDGHIVTDTNWNQFNNDLPIHAQPYSRDSNLWTFIQAEINSIVQAYQRVAEDFAPFDVDVTLEDPSIAEPDIFTVGGRAIRALVSTDRDNVEMGGTGNRWFSDAGGVAYLNSWDWTSDTPVWIFENNLGNGNAKNVAEAASHEVGHAVNLSHDGQTGGVGYYSGHGSGETSWAPIMGVGYNQNVSQWSRGEYPNANQTQNDLNIITTRMPYRADDHSSNKTDSPAATLLVRDGMAVSGSGIIEQNTDVDVFRLEVPAPAVLTLKVNPLSLGPNLDVLAEVLDSSGSVVAVADPPNDLAATLSVTLNPGVYTLAIDGVGNGDLTNGYSDYASLGQFFISGTLQSVTPGDFNLDSLVDAQDIDLLCYEIVAGHHPLVFDLTTDGLVNQLDMDELIRAILGTQYGDANLDSVVDGSDYGTWNSNRFQTGGWAQGNFNCDEVVDGTDFGIWNRYKFTSTTGPGLTSAPVGKNRAQSAPDATPALARIAPMIANAGEQLESGPRSTRYDLPTAIRRFDQETTRRLHDETENVCRTDQVDLFWAGGFDASPDSMI